MDKKEKRFKNRMSKLLKDAQKEGLQFVIIDDQVLIGSKDIEPTWENLIEKGESVKFNSCGEYIISVGA